MSSRLRAKRRLKQKISNVEGSIKAIEVESWSTEDSKQERIKILNQQLDALKSDLKVYEEIDETLLYIEDFRLKLKSIVVLLIIIAVLLIPIVIVSIEALQLYSDLRYNF